MTNFVFPTGFIGAQPTASRSSVVLCYDGANTGASSVASILPLITSSDLASTNVLTNQIGYDGSLSIVPIANPLATTTAISITGATTQTSKREFLVSIGFNNTQGELASNNGDKVGLYTGMANLTSGGSGWSFYSVMDIVPGYGGTGSAAGSKTIYGSEWDLKNSNRDT